MSQKSKFFVKSQSNKPLDKQKSMDSYVGRTASSVERITVYDSTKRVLSNTDYRGRKPLINGKMPTLDQKSIMAYINGGTENLVRPTAAIGHSSLYPDLYNATEYIANITYKTVNLSDRVHFVLPNAYLPSYVFTTADYTSAYDDIVALIASSTSDRYSAFDRFIAKQAIRIVESVRAQSNAHSPFYAMPVSELYDRLKDYFLAVNRAVVLLTNAKILMSEEFCNSCASGALRYYDTYGYKYYHTDDNASSINEGIKQISDALQYAVFVPSILKDYLDLATVSLMPNQSHAFRFIVPRMQDPTNAAVGLSFLYTGSDLFTLSAAGTDASIKVLIANFIAEANNIAAYFYGGSAKLLQSGLTGFNQFSMLGNTLGNVKLAVSLPLLTAMDNAKVRYIGHFCKDTVTQAATGVSFYSMHPAVVKYNALKATTGQIMGVLAKTGSINTINFITADDNGGGATSFYSAVHYDGGSLSYEDKRNDIRIAAAMFDHIDFKSNKDSVGKPLMYFNVLIKPFGLTRIVTDGLTFPEVSGTIASPAVVDADIADRGKSIDIIPTIPTATIGYLTVGDACLVREIDVISRGGNYVLANLNTADRSIVDGVTSGTATFSVNIALSSPYTALHANGLPPVIAAEIMEQMLGVPVMHAGSYGVTDYVGVVLLVTGIGNAISATGTHCIYSYLPFAKWLLSVAADKIELFDYFNYQFRAKIAKQNIRF